MTAAHTFFFLPFACRATRVEQLCSADSELAAAFATRVQQSGTLALLPETPAVATARASFLRALLCTQQLVCPPHEAETIKTLLEALRAAPHDSVAAVEAVLSKMLAAVPGTPPVADSLQAVLLDAPPCAACSENPPAHAPSWHLQSCAGVVALAAGIAACDDLTALLTSLTGLGHAACAACLYLATAPRDEEEYSI